jgi:hypothetical protein
MARPAMTRQSHDERAALGRRRGEAGAYLTGGRNSQRNRASSPVALLLRFGGALALLAMAAVHLQQAVGAHYSDIPTIGTLFVLNFAGGTAVALGLMSPLGRLAGRQGTAVAALVTLTGIAIAATSIVFLLISESTRLFGFRESGYRPAIVVALIAEAGAVILLSTYLLLGRTGQAGK